MPPRLYKQQQDLFLTMILLCAISDVATDLGYEASIFRARRWAPTPAREVAVDRIVLFEYPEIAIVGIRHAPWLGWTVLCSVIVLVRPICSRPSVSG